MLATELLKEAKMKIMLQQVIIIILLICNICLQIKKRVDKG